MGQVQTVRGPVDAGSLGRVFMHEHIFIRSPEIEINWPTDWDAKTAVSKAVDRLTELYEEGGISTIVDLTVPGLGRVIEQVQEVAAQVPINIVVATGYYTYQDLPHYFDGRIAGLRANGVDALDEFFMGDIEDGIAGTGVRAGVLKCATDEQGVTRSVERILRAVARVHRQTGVPISTHSHAATHRGLEQQQIFSEEGVDLSRVVIGHSGDTTDLDYLNTLIDAGSTIGMDRFGIEAYCPTEQRIETVAAMCAQGQAASMVLSHDANCHFDWYETQLLEQIASDWHYMHISRDILPALRDKGVTEEQIDAMLIEAPRRILDHGPGY